VEDILNGQLSGEDEKEKEKADKDKVGAEKAEVADQKGSDQLACQAAALNVCSSPVTNSKDQGKKSAEYEEKKKSSSCFQEEAFFPFRRKKLNSKVDKGQGKKKRGESQELEKGIRGEGADPSRKIMNFIIRRGGIGPAGICPGGVPRVITDQTDKDEDGQENQNDSDNF